MLCKTGLIAMILYTSFAFGQSSLRINELLQKKKLNKVEKYVHRKLKFNKPIAYYRHPKIKQDLTREHQECIYYFSKICQDTSTIGEKKRFTFRVRIIAHKNNIIYYELSKDLRKRINERYIENYQIISSFKNDTAFAYLNKSFYKIFKTEINQNELFIENGRFGSVCGWAGIDPKERIEADMFSKNKDKNSFINWLKSTNTIKQIYAIEGLYHLYKDGVTLTEDELAMISFIKEKKGVIETCFGCMGYSQSIKTITKAFEFTNK